MEKYWKELEQKYSIQETNKKFINIKKKFGNLKINNKKIKIDYIPKPIFILGMPRSGTTLVEQILSNHSAIYAGGELDCLESAIYQSNWQNKNIIEKDILEINKNYILQLNKISNLPFITDKTPLNFWWIGFIIYAFPNAKIINVKRESIATCWSNYKINFSRKGMAFTFNQVHLAKYYKYYENLMKFWNKKFPNKIYNLNDEPNN